MIVSKWERRIVGALLVTVGGLSIAVGCRAPNITQSQATLAARARNLPFARPAPTSVVQQPAASGPSAASKVLTPPEATQTPVAQASYSAPSPTAPSPTSAEPTSVALSLAPQPHPLPAKLLTAVVQDAGGPAPPEVLPTPPPEVEVSRPPQQLDPPAPPGPPRTLGLRQVTESVYYTFPALEAAMREWEIAEGKQRSAWGEFDFKLKTESLSAPLGYYKNHRNQLKLEQALWPGGNVYGQYRIGRGSFPIYFDERETNEGGEFKVGWTTPLLRDRAIDERRAEIFQTTLQRQQVDPYVQGRLLEYTLMAADAYWSWVAAGLGLEAQRDLLRVTIARNRVYEERVKQEDLAQIELIQNERLIAAREAKVIEAERKLQQASIKVSLFLRDEAGQPLLPPRAWLPPAFPEPTAPDRDRLEFEVQQAYDARPELRELALEAEQAGIDLAQGENLRLPMMNAVFEASKDMGYPADSSNTFGPFVLEAGILFDVPLQRRKADGKIIAAQGKLAQIAAKRRFTENKITVEVQDALSGLVTAFERVSRARQNTILARKLEDAERRRFDAADSDLLRVAIQETAAIEAQLLEIETLTDYFKARAAYRAALAIDPLADQP